MYARQRGHCRQMLPNPWLGGLRALAPVVLCVYALGALGSPSPARAADFSDGEMQLSLDTSLSYGLSFRVNDFDEDLPGINSDDGDRNYARGLISNTARIISELDWAYLNFGVFARAQGFVDFENRNSDRERTPLAEAALARVGDDFELLDLYVSGAFDIGTLPLDARLGYQVLNWGESTFIPNSVNVINPIDVARLRKPGAELRDGLLPVPLISLATAVSPALSVEGFYQLAWEETRVDPAGTYFSTNDYAPPGGTRAFLPLPGISDTGYGFGPLTPAINLDFANSGINCQPSSPGPPPTFAGPDCQPGLDPHFLSVPRTSDRAPRDSGQWGLALRYFAEQLNGTEFGLYFVNHHSRLPLVSAIYGTPAGYTAGLSAASAVGAPDSATIAAVTQAISAEVTAGVEAGLIDPADAPARIAAGVSEQIQGIAQLLAIDRYGRTARYFVEHPEDLQVVGVSFNTLLGASGWVLQGEYSFHPDTPLQRTDDSVFEEGLMPLTAALTNSPAAPALQAKLGTYLPGYIQRDVSQVQATATKLFGPTLGADTLAFITEVALAYVHDMPDESKTPLQTHGAGDIVADASAWGYRLAGRLNYNNVIGAARLSPYLQFQHDVDGNSPSPSGPFLEERTVLTLGVGVSYLDRLQTDLSYTMYDGKTNYLSDRDFVSVSATYSF